MRTRARWSVNATPRPYTTRFAGVWIAAVVLTLLTLVFMLWFYLHLPSIQDGIFIISQSPQRLSGRPVQMLYRLERDSSTLGWMPERLRLAGDLWREAGDLRRAFAYWQAALEAAPVAPPADLLHDVAETALELHQWDSARGALDALIAASPNDTWARLQRGILSAALGDLRAGDDLRAALAEPAYAPLAQTLLPLVGGDDGSTSEVRAWQVGAVLARQGLWAPAEVAFSTAAVTLITADERAEAYAALGWVRAQNALSPDDALARALVLAPDNPRVRLFQGLALRADGDEAASLIALQAAVARAPEDTLLMAELGLAYSLLDDPDTARFWLAQAAGLADDPAQAARFSALLDDMTDIQISIEDTLLQQFGFAYVEVTDVPELPEAAASAEAAAPLDALREDRP